MIAIAAAGLLAMATGQAFAQRLHAEGDSVRIGYADLDLRTPVGRAALKSRINMAVEALCPPADPLGMVTRNYKSQCRDQAMASIKPQLDALYARHELASSMIEVTANR
jgi:UrcA family protein